MASLASTVQKQPSFLSEVVSGMRELQNLQYPSDVFHEKVESFAKKIFEKHGLPDPYSPTIGNLQERCQVLYHWMDWAEKTLPQGALDEKRKILELKMHVVNCWAQQRGIQIRWQIRGEGSCQIIFC